MTEVDDYLMNKAGIHGPSKVLTRTYRPELTKYLHGPDLDFSNFLDGTDGFWSVNPWNKDNYQPKIKLPYLLECTSRLSYQKPSDYTTLCGKIIGQIVGDYLFDHRAVAKEMFNSAVGKRESRFDQNQVGCQQIHCPFRSDGLTKEIVDGKSNLET